MICITAMAEIVRNLIIIVILASFLELLLPGGSMRPFVRLTIGFFVLIAVLNPILEVVSSRQTLEVGAWVLPDTAALDDQIMTQGQQLHQQLASGTNDQLRSKLEGQMSAVAMLVPGVDDVASQIELNPDGSIKKVTIHVQPSPQDEATEDAKVHVFSGGTDSGELSDDVQERMTRILENMYGLTGPQIEIKLQGGR